MYVLQKETLLVSHLDLCFRASRQLFVAIMQLELRMKVIQNVLWVRESGPSPDSSYVHSGAIFIVSH